jgi:asparagine synthase (glutamine-hydrolysing)
VSVTAQRFATDGAAADAGQAERAKALRALVKSSLARHPAEGILLSGGLDTSILAPLAAQRATKVAVTVLVGEDAPDGPFATAVARACGLRHRVVRTTLPGLLEDLEFVVRTLVTFDPMEVRNSLVLARALREATALGLRSVMTGDAADELFAGYSYMWGKTDEELRSYTAHLARIMRFSSIPLGRALGIRVETPYADASIVRFALGLSKADKVAVRGGVTWGKVLLRLAFPKATSAWRRKDPIEVGSGSTGLTTYFEKQTDPDAFAAEVERIRRDDRAEIRDAEHLAYYYGFRRVFGGAPPLGRLGPRACVHCGFDLPTPDVTFCVTCGAYPAR